jgi:hypothetical protein
MDQRRALGGRDAAHRGDHLIGTVFQVTQVVSGQRIAGIAGPVCLATDKQRVGDHISGLPQLGQHWVVRVPDASDGIERRWPFGLEFG